MSNLAEAVSLEFKRVLVSYSLSASAAARMLGVSRQAFHGYLNGSSVPRRKVLAKALDLWAIKIVVGQVVLDRAALGSNMDPASTVATQLELSLWKKLDAISEDDLHIQFTREGKTLKVAVSIDIPA